MQRARVLVSLLALSSIAAGSALAAPVVSELSSSTVEQSDRFFIRGSGFGDERGHVEVGGEPLAITRWADDVITAFVTAEVPLGTQALRVLNDDGASDAVELVITPRSTGAGALAWTFQGDAPYALHRPAVGPDGTVYASDVEGLLYAISHDGRLLWIYDAARESGVTSGAAGEGPVQVGADGTVYLAFNPIGPDVEVHAIRPDGSNKWIVANPALNTIAGPALGPDGNLYVAHAASEEGVLSIRPDGFVQRTHVSDPLLLNRGSLGAELVFGPSEPGGPVDQVYMALDMSAWQQFDPEPSLLAFGLDLGLRFRAPIGALTIAGGQRDGQPAVGPSGTVYVSTTAVGEGWGVHAFSPEDGSRKWRWYEIPGNTMSEPAVGPDDTVYVVRNITFLTALDDEGSVRWVEDLGGSFGGPALHPEGGYLVVAGEAEGHLSLRAHDAVTGGLLWEQLVPDEDGFEPSPAARPYFAPAGDRVYLPVTFPARQDDPAWSLVAVDVVACPDGVVRCGPPGDGGVPDDGGVDAGDPAEGGVYVDAGDAGRLSDAGPGAADPEAMDCGGCSSSSALQSGWFLVALVLWRRRRAAGRAGSAPAGGDRRA